MKQQVVEAAEIVKAALQEGLVQPKDIELFRRQPASLSIEEKKTLQNQIAELERQLTELRTPKVPKTPEQIERERRIAERRDHDGTRGPIPQEQVDLLFNTFNSIITRRTKREPLPTEIAKFDDLIATMQKVKPLLKFVQARIQIENLARQIAAVATAGRIILRRGQARIDELLDTMLTRRLSEDEEDELRRLREGEELTSLEVIEYEPPTIVLIAESGPEKYPLGRALKVDSVYPREIGRYFEMFIAQENASLFEKRGYKIKIEGQEAPRED